jgi:hypothetical protein
MEAHTVSTKPQGTRAEWIGDDEYDEDDVCQRCGGDGYIMASEGDPSDWGEDTYCGPEDAVMACPDCWRRALADRKS